MDTSFWIRLNPEIQITKSKKLYYNQYPFSLTLKFGEPFENPDLWGINELLNFWDLKEHFHWHKIRYQDLGIKIVNRYLGLRIYTKSARLLKDFFEKYQNKIFIDYLESVHMPKELEKQYLLEGKIPRVRPSKFQYRVFLSRKFLDSTMLQNVVNFIDRIGDSVQGNKEFQRIRHSKKYYCKTYYPNEWYFDTNDITIISYLNLVCPGIVLKYKELVHAPR
jgi:hypothetical protein